MSQPQIVTFRPTAEDYKILSALSRKLGIKRVDVLRQSLRLLAAKELKQQAVTA